MAAKLQMIMRLKSTPIFFFIRYGESWRIEAIAFRETDCFIVSRRTLDNFAALFQFLEWKSAHIKHGSEHYTNNMWLCLRKQFVPQEWFKSLCVL